MRRPSWPWRRRRPPVFAAPLDTLLDPGFVALDLETTGLDPRRDVIVELAAIPFIGGHPGNGYVTRVDPERAIPAESSRIHGITDPMVQGAQRVGPVLGELAALLEGRPIVGHGIGFDLAVLARECRAHGRAVIADTALDTGLIASALHPHWGRFDFDEVAARYGIGILGRHTAEGDALAAGELLLALLPEVRSRGLRTVGEVLWLQGAAIRG
jgi:DNA polymerase III epsilon subunit-like protein